MRGSFGPEEEDVLSKLRRPSEGTWLNLLTRTLVRLREQNLGGLVRITPDRLRPGQAFGQRERLGRQSRPSLSYLEKKTVVRTQASVQEFLEVLVRYRNETIGHGAVLSEDLNEANGVAILKGVEEIFRSVPFWAQSELKYVSQVNLDTNSVVCRYISLTGPDWLAIRLFRIRPAS